MSSNVDVYVLYKSTNLNVDFRSRS